MKYLEYHTAAIIDLFLNLINRYFVILTIHVKYWGSIELPHFNQYIYDKIRLCTAGGHSYLVQKYPDN